MTQAAALGIYRAVTGYGEAAGPVFLGWRLRRGKEDAGRIGERLGHAGAARPDGPLVWLHGASVGEGVALLPLVEALLGSGLGVLLTTGTVTSARILAGRLPPGAQHQFVPLDLPRAVRRFFDHWRPDLACFAESELWPNLLHEARRRAVPTLLVNARMSGRSFARWRRVARVAAGLLANFSLVLAQSAGDAERYRRLGAPAVAATGNLKFDVPPPGADPAALADLRSSIGERPVWVAASTHAGEDELCCAAHATLRDRYPDLLTIVVPRKPDRGPAIAAAAHAMDLTARLRSRGEMLDAETSVYVADTMGEIGLFYRVARIAFVGKSLVGDGGQNPIEAGKLGAAILHGPAVANFDEIYRTFDDGGGSLLVADGPDLERSLGRLLAAPDVVADMGRRAAATIVAQGGTVARTMAAMEPLLAAIRSGRAA